MIIEKDGLKRDAIRMFSNTHKDNANKAELLRCVKVCNGVYMACDGVQLGKAVVDEVYQELEKQFFKN